MDFPATLPAFVQVKIHISECSQRDLSNGTVLFSLVLLKPINGAQNRKKITLHSSRRNIIYCGFQSALDSASPPATDTRLLENDEMFEGDIVGMRSMLDVRNAILSDNLRWPHAEIPYAISATFCT